MLNTFIRAARIDDVSALTALVNSAYRGEDARAGWTNESAILGGSRTDEAHIARLVQSDLDVVLVCLAGDGVDAGSADGLAAGDIVGCVHLERKNETTTYLGMLTTSPRAQGGGIGSRLMQAGEEYARREWRAKLIEMTVIDIRTELIAYYVRRGYRVTGEKRPFPDDPVNGSSLVGKITFDVLVKEL